MLRDLLKQFLTTEVECEADKQDQKKMLLSRLNQFHIHVNSIARNSEDIGLLQTAGYSPVLWTKVAI